MKFTLKDFDPNRIMAGRGLGKKGMAQHKMASELARLCDPYVPMRQGVLKNTCQVGNGFVRYVAPYAKYQYYGKLMVGRAPKALTATDLKHSGAPMRGPFWDKRMMADKGDTLIDGVAKLVGGKRK